MSEMVASRCRQMLNHMVDIDKEEFGKRVEKLVSALKKIEKLLYEYGNRKIVQENMQKLRKLAYNIEDALETWAFKVESEYLPSKNVDKKFTITLLRCCRKKGDTDTDVIFSLMSALSRKITSRGGTSIDWLNETFTQDALGSCVNGGEGNMLEYQDILMDPYGREEHFVDIKKHLGKLIPLVTDDKGPRVVKICGVKGLGKTTLARRVYVHPEVREHFKAFAWVSLREDNQISSHLEGMLIQLGAEEEDQQKGAEENEERAEEKTEGAQEKAQGDEENAEEAEEIKEGIEEKEEGAEENEEGAEEIKEGAEEDKEGAEEKKEDAEEKEQRAEENEEGAEENKKGAEEMKEGAEENKEGAEKQKEGEEEKRKGVEEQDKGTVKKKEGADLERRRKNGHEKYGTGIQLRNIKKQGRADEPREGAEEQKKGADLVRRSSRRKSGLEHCGFGMLFCNLIKQGGAMKKSPLERKEGIDNKGLVKKTDAGEKNGGVSEPQNNSEEKMMDQLKKTLKKKNCLVVIDSISGLHQLENIINELNHTNSKLLVTAENETTVNEGELYKLVPLKEDEGWQLLKKYAFPENNAPDLGLVPRLGKEMVRKCDYLPWKISKLGRTLSAMPLSDWPKVNNDVDRYLNKKSPTESNEKKAANANNDISSYCKRLCFLYLAMFKENDDIDPEDLSFLWMAEGIVPPQQLVGSTVMDFTEKLFQELHSSNLLKMQMDEFTANRRFFPYSLENHKSELSLVMGGKKEFHFHLKVADFSGGKEPRFDAHFLDEGTRRLAIHFDKLSSSCKKHDLNATSDLRSLLFLNSDQEYAYLPVKISDFKDFKLLRVLHFLRCKFEDRKLPDGIWKLTNLWYFGLSHCEVDELSSDISNFRNLHVLNVRSYDDATEIIIPNNIYKLVKLKHLRLPHNSVCDEKSDKLKLDGLNDLETLVGFDVHKHDLGTLLNSKKFRYLETRASCNDSLESIIGELRKFKESNDGGGRFRINLLIEHKCDFTSPKGLSVLEEVLMCPNLDALTFSMVYMQKFPDCEKYASSYITQIKLIGCKLSKDPMKALGMFPNLTKLCLGYEAFVGRMMAICGAGLPKLEYLEFRCLPYLEKWIVDKGALQNLSTLIIKGCPMLKRIPEDLASRQSPKNLKKIPEGLASFPALKNLDMELTHEVIDTSVKSSDKPSPNDDVAVNNPTHLNTTGLEPKQEDVTVGLQEDICAEESHNRRPHRNRKVPARLKDYVVEG